MTPTAKLYKKDRQLLVRKPTLETRYFFLLIGTNGEPVARSEPYNSKQAAKDTLHTYFSNFVIKDES